MADLLTAPITQLVSSTGAPLSGGKVYTYVTGGSLTPKATYTDSSGVTPLANPVVLDSNGAAEIWLSGAYRIRITDSNDVLLYDVDDVNQQSTTSTQFTDSAFLVVNSSDATKKIQFSAASLTTGTTRIYTWPDKNGTVAMISDIPIIYSHIAGCTISGITGTSTTATFAVSAGQCANSANSAYIVSAGYTWAASNGNAINGTDAAASTLANSTTYHVFLCSGTSGTGTFVSSSLTPTFPTGYTTSSRRIGSFKTNGSGAPIAYTTVEGAGGCTINWLATQTMDVNVVNLSTSRTLYVLNVPGGVKVQPLIRAASTTGAYVIITSGDETDVAPATAYTTAPMFDLQNTVSVANTLVPRTLFTTDTSAQIGARASAGSTSFNVVTSGWIDFRRA